MLVAIALVRGKDNDSMLGWLICGRGDKSHCRGLVVSTMDRGSQKSAGDDAESDATAKGPEKRSGEWMVEFRDNPFLRQEQEDAELN